MGAPVTDDERQRAAERLRKLRGLDYCKDPRYAVELASDAIEADHGSGYSWDKMLDRLADLIEPSCNREALMALTDDLDYAGANVENVAYIDQTFHESARRIREACGDGDNE